LMVSFGLAQVQRRELSERTPGYRARVQILPLGNSNLALLA
jgi:hypothetical protein